MTDKSKEVKKILEKTEWDGGLIILDNVDEIVRQICQLLEPKPDEGRLLTDEDLLEILDGHWENFLIKWYREKLIAKTASIKDAEIKKDAQLIFDSGYCAGKVRGKSECQERIEGIFKKIDQEMPLKHYENGGFHHISKDCKLCWWQALKKKEGVE